MQVAYQPVAGDTTATGFRIIDESGTTHFQRNYPRTADEDAGSVTYHVQASGYGPKAATALAIFEEVYPSAPLTGASLRILVPRAHRLVELTPPITLYGNVGGYRDDVHVFDVWRYEFALIVPVAIDFSCINADASCLTPRPKSKLEGDLALYDVRTDLRAIEEAATIALYRTPGTEASETIPVTPGTKVQVLEAAATITIKFVDNFLRIDAENDWLHVRIDEREGWISGSRDFMAIGLPSAG